MAVVIYAPRFDFPGGSLCGSVWVAVAQNWPARHVADVCGGVAPALYFWRGKGDAWVASAPDPRNPGLSLVGPAAPRPGGLAPPPLPDFVVEVPRDVLEADGAVGAWKPTHVHAPPGLPPRYLYATKRPSAGATARVAYALEGWLDNLKPFAVCPDGIWREPREGAPLDLTPVSTYERNHADR